MTSKKHVMHRLAVATAVLLTFCLVFMMPVGATGVTCTNGTACTYHAAVVGDMHYDDLQVAITEAAPNGGTVTLLRDVTVNEWIMFSETLSIGSGQLITLSINGLTIDGNGKTLTVKSIESASNGNRLFYDATNLNIKDLTIKCVEDAANQGGIGLTSGTISNVAFEGGGCAVLPGDGEITIDGCTFKTTATSIYFEEERDGLTVSGCTIENADNVNTILIHGDVTFTNNIINSGRTVNVVSGSPTVSGNNFNNVRLKVYNGATATISDNTINVLAFDDGTEVKSTFVGNLLSDAAKTVLTNAGVKAVYTITVTATPAEYGTASASPKTAEENTEITLTATAKEGYVFKGWTMSNNIAVIGDNKFTMPAGNVEITAVFEEKKEEPVTTPDFSETIQTDDEESKEVTITIDEETTNVKGNVVTVEDKENGVTMTVTFTSVPTPGDSEDGEKVTGTVAEVKVTYEEKAAEVGTSSEETTGTVDYSMVLDLTKADIKLPTLNPAFDSGKENTIKGTPGLSGHTPLVMITATETDEVNADMKANSGNQVAFTFKISKSLLNGKSMKHLVGYHIADDGKVTKIVPNSGDRKEENNYIYVTIYGDKFSTYAVGISDKEEEVITTQIGGGSATDTGSGNYQYYPRSVPTDGIISFGTSKVVTGMELPAGSDGTVTLNIKPTFDMPENGFYAFEIDAPGYNLDAKINGGLSFQIPVADLEAAGYTAEDIVLFHGTVAEDGKIVWEALPTNLVKNENGIAYYKAVINGCSPFYIGFVEDGSIINTEAVDPVTPPTETPETPVTPDEPEVLPPADEPQDEPTEEPATPAPLLAVLAGLGAVIALRRK